MSRRQQAQDHPLAAAVAAEQEEYAYEIEGAPWWMPINQDIVYEPGAPDDPNYIDNIDGNVQPVIDPLAEDVVYMDSVKVIVNDNPWLQHMADRKHKGGIIGGIDDSEQLIKEKEKRRKYLLSIDFQVNCRKYILFTSLLFVIVIMTFISSVLTGFYEWKGWSFNFTVSLILLYGIIIGFNCSDITKYKARSLLKLLNIYWSIAWITIIGLVITACIYLILFPSKFRNYCNKHNYCDATTEAIVFAECSLVCTLILYILLMFFYMQRIANLVIIISNLGDYTLKYEQSLFHRICHKHIYRYLKGWKSFRRIISKYTGLRISDILYCSCWFRKCKRSSSKQWKPIPKNENTIKLTVDGALQQHYSSLDDIEKQQNIKEIKEYDEENKYEDDEQKKQEEKQKNKLYEASGNNGVYVSQKREYCCCCCDNITYSGYNNNATDCWLCYFCCRDCCIFCDCNDICNGCGQCIGDICRGIGHCCSGCNCDGFVCCVVYHTDSVGDCSECCKACCGICSGCIDCHHCCDNCKCDGCDGGEGIAGICMAILVAIVCIILFLLPIIVFAIIAAPFWLLAQAIVWKLNNKVPWIIVVFIFIIFMIPPCIIWGVMWTAICHGNMNGTFMTVMCQIWSFFYTVYSSFE